MGDLIDRRAATKSLVRPRVKDPYDQYWTGRNDQYAADVSALKDLPSAEIERKTGKWVGVKEYCDHLNEKAEREGNGHRFIPSGMNICVYCNQCWESNDRRTTYCPNCGADMRGEEGANN